MTPPPCTTSSPALTNLHEAVRDQPWQTSDAPPEFMAAQLRGIVGFRLTIQALAGKWKLSQNRPAADIAGVVEGYATAGDAVMADAVAREGERP